MVNGRMGNAMGGVVYTAKMAVFMKDIGRRTKNMDKVNIFGQMVVYTLEHGN